MPESTPGKIPAVAYLNDDFLKSPDARVLRVLSEYLEPAARLRRFNVRDTIVFFGSARSFPKEITEARLDELKKVQSDTDEHKLAITSAEQAVRLSRYYQDAVELARRITEWSKGLTGQHHFIVCSGGSGGMMEAANRGASQARGKSLGLNIQLPLEQDINPYVSRELVFNFHYFFMRKFWFVYLAKALIVFPGGFGTMDELFEVLTLIQTKMPRKSMPVVLFGTEFWDDIINFDAFVKWGVVSQHDLQIFFKTDSVDEAFEHVTRKLEKLYLSDKGLDEVKLT
jgi:uncharacterized protein (TIGR00730 family)